MAGGRQAVQALNQFDGAREYRTLEVTCTCGQVRASAIPTDVSDAVQYDPKRAGLGRPPDAGTDAAGGDPPPAPRSAVANCGNDRIAPAMDSPRSGGCATGLSVVPLWPTCPPAGLPDDSHNERVILVRPSGEGGLLELCPYAPSIRARPDAPAASG